VKKAGAAHAQELSPMQTLRTPQYWMIAFAMLLACAAGLMVIPFAKVLGTDGGLTPAAAGIGVMVITGFNSAGRLFWGFVSDKLGRKKTLMLLMIVAAAAIPFAAMVQGYFVLILIAIVGFSYGGFLGVFPALTADFFGIKNMGVNYGMVLMGFGIGAVAASFIAGYYKDLAVQLKDMPNAPQFPFLVPFLIASGAALAALVLTAFLKPPKKKDA
jgi:OFA family oxalate/formate antiporter-like MFS transporter